MGHYPRLRNIFIMVNFCGNAVFVRGFVWITSQTADHGTEKLSERPESPGVPQFLVCREYKSHLALNTNIDTNHVSTRASKKRAVNGSIF